MIPVVPRCCHTSSPRFLNVHKGPVSCLLSPLIHLGSVVDVVSHVSLSMNSSFTRYVTGLSDDPGAEFVFVQYKGHTLQGSYEGGFVYARKPYLPSAALAKVTKVARVS